MRTLNEKYEGAGGQSISNSIQAFHEGRKFNKATVFGKLMDRFGSSIKEFFVQSVPIMEYTRALLDLIQVTYYIEEWLKFLLHLKQKNKNEGKPFMKKDENSIDYLKKICNFLQDVVMVIVLNDCKYLLSFYMIGMQNALVEDSTLTQMNEIQR